MKKDLTAFEKDLLKSINMLNNTKYNHNNLMEWSTDKKVVEKSLKEGEKIYEAFGCFVAIKTNQ